LRHGIRRQEQRVTAPESGAGDHRTSATDGAPVEHRAGLLSNASGDDSGNNATMLHSPSVGRTCSRQLSPTATADTGRSSPSVTMFRS
jgi:hypothetical protein